MHSELVLFDLPEGLSREALVAGMHEVVPSWRGRPALVRKTFLYDPAARQAGALYLWTDRSAGEAAHGETWRARLRAAYGSDPVVRWFQTPLVIDNALDAVIAEAQAAGA